MRIVSVAVSLVAAVALIAPAAMAQYDSEQPSKLSLKVGLYRLTGSDDRAKAGKRWYTEEVLYNYKLNDRGLPVGQAGLGLYEGSGGSDSSMIVVTASSLWWQEKEAGNLFYGGVGIGAYRMKHLGDQSVKAGVQLFGGYTFHDAYFAELRLTIVPSWTADSGFGYREDINLSGWTAAIGIKRLL